MTKTVDWYNKKFPPGRIVAVIMDDGNVKITKIILPFSTISGRPVAWLQGFRSCFAADRVREVSAKEPITLGNKDVIGKILLQPIMDVLNFHLREIPRKHGMTTEELVRLCCQEIGSLQAQKAQAISEMDRRQGKLVNNQIDLLDLIKGEE
jgi:hypothetical protein